MSIGVKMRVRVRVKVVGRLRLCQDPCPNAIRHYFLRRDTWLLRLRRITLVRGFCIVILGGILSRVLECSLLRGRMRLEGFLMGIGER